MKQELPCWYVRAKKEIKKHLKPENYDSFIEETISPDGQYKFVVNSYKTDLEHTYYLGSVYNYFNLIHELSSNANNFWHCWIIHEGKTYLICNEDVQGYTIVSVENGDIYPYRDPKATTGWGFSLRKAFPSPDGRWIAIQGDTMGCNIENYIYDFSDPTNIPLPKKSLNVSSDYELTGWNNNRITYSHFQKNKTIEVIVHDIETIGR